MTTTQAIIAQTGKAAIAYTLEFRTWNGSAYVWTDYTDRLVDFSGIGSTVEENAFPNAFRMSIGNIELDNTDGKLDNLDVLDGKLYNAAEPYGKGIYKRMVRITDVRDNESKVIGVGLVRDIKPSSHKRTVIIETISLDARAADQMCDGVTAERHPLGGTDKTAPANWTTSNPASATANVNMYRWRQEETVDDQVSYGWFKERHYADIIERTAWALDDLATNITKSYRLMTGDGREIATMRNIPPDDATISTGVTPERCRALVWNPARNVLVCCVGHLIYDYDPLTNVYTQRNVLTPGRDVQRAFYTTEPDSGSHNSRIVLVLCDMATYAQVASRVATAWVVVLNAEGTGAYTPLAGEVSLGADVFPGTHNCREGNTTFYSGPAIAGRWTDIVVSGENPVMRLKGRVNAVGAGTTKATEAKDMWYGLFQLIEGTQVAVPCNVPSGYFAAATNSATAMGLLYPSDPMFSCSLNIYNTGGRLYYHTWDSTNKYRLRYFDLYSYTAGAYLALGGAATHVPYYLYSAPDAAWNRYMYCCQMEWREVAATDQPDYCHVYFYDFSTSAWTEITILNGATGEDIVWMVTEIIYHPVSGVHAIWFNRVTRYYRLSRNLVSLFTSIAWVNWINIGGVDYFVRGACDVPFKLEGMHRRAADDMIFFVDSGANRLWSLNASNVLAPCNMTPASGPTSPINSDRGLGSMIVSTPANYPDASTPNGILWWMSANDFVDAGVDHPQGRYILCQYANYDPGFIELLDVSGLSFWDLRTLLAERVGFVHYYAPDGTLIFKSRVTSGAAQFAFNSDNRNLIKGGVQTRGFEAIINDITVFPYGVELEIKAGDIAASAFGDELLNDVNVSSSPGENAQWRLIFTTTTDYDLFKMQGVNYSATVKKASGTITTILRSPTDGTYLTIFPDAFTGTFAVGDNFTFWVLEAGESLTQLDSRDRVRTKDDTSIAASKRVAKTFDNRFIPKQIAPDYAANILLWRKNRHDVVKIEVVSDPNYLPLLRCTLKDENMGYAGTETFQIMGVEHRRHQPSNLVLVKV